jgi:hypothetical protein
MVACNFTIDEKRVILAPLATKDSLQRHNGQLEFSNLVYSVAIAMTMSGAAA